MPKRKYIYGLGRITSIHITKLGICCYEKPYGTMEYVYCKRHFKKEEKPTEVSP
jgi:hypothetical protein